jgi:hypothetical protein
MANPQFDQPTNAAAIWLLIALSFTLGACSAGTNCALFGLQCGAPTPEQDEECAAAGIAALAISMAEPALGNYADRSRSFSIATSA